MAKTVFLLRHGKSDWSQAGAQDQDRPLNARGRSAVPRVGRWLVEHDLVPDRIVTSTAVRAYSTAVLLADSMHYDKNLIVLDSNLYLAEPEAHAAALTQLSQSHPKSITSVLLVGHNPGISEAASLWARLPIELPTAALVQLELDVDDWSEVTMQSSARLVELIKPREL